MLLLFSDKAIFEEFHATFCSRVYFRVEWQKCRRMLIFGYNSDTRSNGGITGTTACVGGGLDTEEKHRNSLSIQIIQNFIEFYFISLLL